MKTITINGKEYRIRQTVRALFLWEQIAGKAFEIKTTMDNYLYYYCLILAADPDTSLTWDDFIDAIDADPSILIQMTRILADAQQRDKIFDSQDAEGKKKS